VLTRRALLALIAAAAGNGAPAAKAASRFDAGLIEALAADLAAMPHGSDWRELALKTLPPPADPAAPAPIGVRPIAGEQGFSGQTEVFLVEDGSPAPLGGMGGFEVEAETGGAAALFQFIGATFFRFRAAGEVFGTISRAIALRTADPRGEEMPVFRAIWIEPAAGPGAVAVTALLDSPSTTASCRIVIKAGIPVTVSVDIVLNPREALRSVGLAPLSSTYLFAAGDGSRPDDWRPAVHDARGLLMLNGNGERLWRTLTNPRDLQISAFADRSPRAFGLIQRDRRFETYGDADERFESRPSMIVETAGDWGAGFVMLIEIPSQSEANDNIQVFWQPETPLAAGRPHRFAYTISGADDIDPVRPTAEIAAVRSGAAPGDAGGRTFVIDYAVSASLSPAIAATAKASVWASAGTVDGINVTRLPNGSVRTRFTARRLSNGPVELRADLYFENAAPAEAWLHRWS
jgi:periplasmic glucans biosynthesis protein